MNVSHLINYMYHVTLFVLFIYLVSYYSFLFADASYC
jgi:citrate lyase synthetase